MPGVKSRRSKLDKPGPERFYARTADLPRASEISNARSP
jgi:hypothetical protein